MQPYFFPYLGYFSLLDSVDVFVIYDDVNFIRRGWINRNYFLGSKGSYRYTLPIQNVSQNKKICDLFISDIEKQKRQFMTSIQHSYGKSPYYKQVHLLLEQIFSCNSDNLSIFLAHSLQCLSDYIGISTKIVRASDLQIAQEKSREDRIIAMCKSLGASVYINAAGGTDLYKSQSFSDNDLELMFINFEGEEYQQYTQGSFIKDLSVIDGLMFNSPSQLLSIIKRCTIKHG